MNHQLTAETRPRRIPGIQQQPRDGELMLYYRERDPGWILNHAAWTIWNLCDGRHTIGDIARTVVRAFGEEWHGQSEIEDQVRESVARLADIGLLWVVEDPRRPIEWERVARATEESHPLALELSLPDASNGASMARNGGRALFDGALVVLDGSDGTELDVPATLVAADPDHRSLPAAEALVSAWPAGARDVRAFVRSLLPVQSAPASRARRDKGYDPSEPRSDASGAMWSSVDSPVALAENLVGEAARQKMRRLGVHERHADRLVGNPASLLYGWPAIDERELPMSGVVHSLYARMYVAQLHAALLAQTEVPPEVEADEAWRTFVDRTVDNLGRIESALEHVLSEIATDEPGRRFFAGLRAWFVEIEKQTKEAQQRRLESKCPRVSVREPMRVFVATDDRQPLAEIVLEYSLRKHARGPVQVSWMDASRGAPFCSWKKGKKAVTSCFRFAVPELAGFRGRALYLDVDMLVLTDLRELLDEPMHRPWLVTTSCPAAAVVDCAYFSDKGWWPRICEMAASGSDLGRYQELLSQHGAIGRISNRWNSHDGAGYVEGRTGIVHFTKANTQPWRPDAERDYAHHESLELEVLWWQTYAESQGTHFRGYSRQRPSTRYLQLLDAYRDMHQTIGDALLGIPPDKLYRGEMTLVHAKSIRSLIKKHGAKRLFDYGSGKGHQYTVRLDELAKIGLPDLQLSSSENASADSLSAYWGVEEIVCYDPGAGLVPEFEPRGFDGVISTDVLEHCSELDLPWIVREMFSLARAFVFASVSTRPARRRLPTGENAHEIRRPPGFWAALFATVRADYPDIDCRLVCDEKMIHL